jgi:hypothetical protein
LGDPQELEMVFLPDYIGEKVGDSDLDKFIDQEFAKREQADVDDKELMHPWLLWNNCKHEASKLVKDAKAAQAEAKKD